MERNNELIVRDAELLYRNFSGRVDQYNRDGRRYFNMYIDDEEVAKKLSEDGWRVSIRMPRNPEDGGIRYSLKVIVSYRFEPHPIVCRIVNGAEYYLNEDSIAQLDNDHILRALVKVHGAGRDKNPDGKFTAYLDKMVVECEEDPFDVEYRNMFGEQDPIKED